MTALPIKYPEGSTVFVMWNGEKRQVKVVNVRLKANWLPERVEVKMLYDVDICTGSGYPVFDEKDILSE